MILTGPTSCARKPRASSLIRHFKLAELDWYIPTRHNLKRPPVFFSSCRFTDELECENLRRPDRLQEALQDSSEVSNLKPPEVYTCPCALVRIFGCRGAAEELLLRVVLSLHGSRSQQRQICSPRSSSARSQLKRSSRTVKLSMSLCR